MPWRRACRRHAEGQDLGLLADDRGEQEAATSRRLVLGQARLGAGMASSPPSADASQASSGKARRMEPGQRLEIGAAERAQARRVIAPPLPVAAWWCRARADRAAAARAAARPAASCERRAGRRRPDRADRGLPAERGAAGDRRGEPRRGVAGERAAAPAATPASASSSATRAPAASAVPSGAKHCRKISAALAVERHRQGPRPARAAGGTAAATAAKLVIPMSGSAGASASPRAAASPMRTPVKEPGPTVTATRWSAAEARTPELANTASIIGISASAWPRSIGWSGAPPTLAADQHRRRAAAPGAIEGQERSRQASSMPRGAGAGSCSGKTMPLVEITEQPRRRPRPRLRHGAQPHRARRSIADAICYLHAEAAALLERAVGAGAAARAASSRSSTRCGPSEAQWALWNARPDPEFLADPRRGSPHSRGAAIDLTLIDGDGAALDMGTGVRCLHALVASRRDRVRRPAAQRNRLLLLGLMTAAGWDFYRNEWWHYQLFDAGASRCCRTPTCRGR